MAGGITRERISPSSDRARAISDDAVRAGLYDCASRDRGALFSQPPDGMDSRHCRYCNWITAGRCLRFLEFCPNSSHLCTFFTSVRKLLVRASARLHTRCKRARADGPREHDLGRLPELGGPSSLPRRVDSTRLSRARARADPMERKSIRAHSLLGVHLFARGFGLNTSQSERCKVRGTGRREVSRLFEVYHRQTALGEHEPRPRLHLIKLDSCSGDTDKRTRPPPEVISRIGIVAGSGKQAPLTTTNFDLIGSDRIGFVR